MYLGMNKMPDLGQSLSIKDKISFIGLAPFSEVSNRESLVVASQEKLLFFRNPFSLRFNSKNPVNAPVRFASFKRN